MNGNPDEQSFRPPRRDGQRLVRWSKRRAVQRYGRLLRRCLDMAPQEVVHRVGVLLGGKAATNGTHHVTTDSGDGARRSESLRAQWFFGPDDDRVRRTQLAEIDPDFGDRVRNAAGGLRHEGAEIFGRRVALAPDTLDWQADPVSGRRLWPAAPLDETGAVAWAQRPGGARPADVKYVWELNRHQYLPTLGCAYWLDHDAVSAELAASLVDRWIVQNPPGLGVNWSSRLEVAVRAIAWLWAMAFLLGWEELGAGRRDRWIASLTAHYDFLRRNLSPYADRTNHLIGEAAALWMLATVMPDLSGAATERVRALEVLRVEAERQITADGVSREQSVGYHCFVLDFYVQVIALARRHGAALPPIIESRATGMLAFLSRLLGTGGDVPHIGDGDDGRAIPFPCPPTVRARAESLLAVGADLFDRPEWLSHAAGATDLPVWLLGGATPRLSGGARRPAESTVLREGGYCFLEATTGDQQSRQLIFDVGGLGYLPNAAHEHADALSILIRVNQTLVLADPGTGMYTGSPTVRDGFRGTASHNTVTIDDLDQADVLDTFKWVNPTTTEIIGWSASPAFDYAAAVHDGYRRLRRPVRHCREVLFVKPEYWIVVDRIGGRGVHRVARRFHFPPDVTVERVDRETFDAVSRASGDGLRFVFPQHAAAPTTLFVEDVPWSARYGSWERARCLVAETTGEPPLPLATVIVPLSVDGPAVVLRDCTAGDSAAAQVLYRAWVMVGSHAYEDSLAVPSALPVGGAGAGSIFVRRDECGQVVRAFGEHAGRGH